jgi:DNA-binding transcriptional LysR family regulator
MDQLKRMAVFAEVVAAGSLTAAARRLGMTPSAVSQHLRQLEGALGLALLHRSTRKLTLTEAGARYIEGCTAMVAAARAAEQALERHRDEPEGELRIAAPIGFGGLLARALAPLRRHPRLTLQLLLDDALVDLIEARVDIALRAGSLPDSSLVARRLGSMGAQMCAAPAYLAERGWPLARRKTWRSTTGWAPGPSAPRRRPGAAQRRWRDGHGAGQQPCPGQPGHGPACAVRRGLGHRRGRQRGRPPCPGRRAPGAGAAGLAVARPAGLCRHPPARRAAGQGAPCPGAAGGAL